MSLKLKLLLWVHNTFIKKDVDKISIEGFRSFANNRDHAMMDGPPIALRRVEDEIIKGRNGAIPIRLYFPQSEVNLPVIVYFHGGGFVIGNLDSHDKVCRRISRDNQAIVVAVDYRLAPEHKFPAAPKDCYDATKWVAENIEKYGGDPSRLVVMGDSAGGNLATVTAIQARDLGEPAIAFQVLVYPTTDARMRHPSIDSCAEGYILTKALMHWFLDHYMAKEADKVNPLMSPLLTSDLSNLPPALVQTAGYDPLQDEGKEYAEKLKAAGNEVFYTHYPDLIHTYFTMPKFSKRCLATHQEIAIVLSKVFDKTTSVKRTVNPSNH